MNIARSALSLRHCDHCDPDNHCQPKSITNRMISIKEIIQYDKASILVFVLGTISSVNMIRRMRDDCVHTCTPVHARLIVERSSPCTENCSASTCLLCSLTSQAATNARCLISLNYRPTEVFNASRMS